METIRRAEDAELEMKGAAILLRCGHGAKALIERAAQHCGESVNRYVRQATVKQALLDTADLPESDHAAVAHHP